MRTEWMVDVGVEEGVWTERMVEVCEEEGGGEIEDGSWKAREEPVSMGSSYKPLLGTDLILGMIKVVFSVAAVSQLWVVDARECDMLFTSWSCRNVFGLQFHIFKFVVMCNVCY